MAEVALTYEEFCKQRCEWCRRGGFPRYNGGHGMRHKSPEERGIILSLKCTAPSIEAAYSELAERVAALEEDKVRLEWWIANNEDIGRLWLDLENSGRWFWEYGIVLEGNEAMLYDTPRQALDGLRAARAKETT